MQLARGEVIVSAACGAACGACAVLWLLRSPLRDGGSSPAGRAVPTSLEGIVEYNQLWVGADGSTQVAQGLVFSGLERKGYSGTPQASATSTPPAESPRTLAFDPHLRTSAPPHLLHSTCASSTPPTSW